MDIWPGAARTYLSADRPDEGEGFQMFSPEVLNTFECGNIPPHELKLKPDVIIMLLRNMSPAKGLMNGTRLTVHCGAAIGPHTS
eukprot:5846776-Pyramimonas_sp.AAC.1